VSQHRGHQANSEGNDRDVVQLRPAPGKATRSERLVQRKGDGGGLVDVQTRAAEGVAGGGENLPVMDMISPSFGAHDVSDVRAHTGGEAAAAAADIGAQAYATGNDVAFAGSPDLHTAAHEAAHVVQQRAGVQLEGGVGEAGDAYEHHADRVADAVVQGKSAEGMLDQMSGRGGERGVQMLGEDEADPLPKKKVGGDAMGRLGLASKAIAHTKSIFKFGAGNQMEAIRATGANSTIRMNVMRDEDNEYWEIAESVYELINDNLPAFTAAKAELMDGGGGNCGEHADVAFDYLCVTGAGNTVTVAQQKDFDHAFVLIGNLDSDSDAQIAVADAWPTRPTAVLWEDHFAHCDRKLVLRHNTAVAGGKSAKNAIKAGLRLNAKGKAALTEKLDKKDTEQLIKDGRKGDHPWIWNHANTAEPGHEFNYTE
jgi:hypothetical protein